MVGLGVFGFKGCVLKDFLLLLFFFFYREGVRGVFQGVFVFLLRGSFQGCLKGYFFWVASCFLGLCFVEVSKRVLKIVSNMILGDIGLFFHRFSGKQMGSSNGLENLGFGAWGVVYVFFRVYTRSLY